MIQKRIAGGLTAAFFALAASALADPVGGNGSYPSSGGGGGGAVYPAPSASPFPQGCQYNTTLPVATSGQTIPQQCDVNGRSLFNGVISAPSPLPVQAGSFARTNASGTITTGGTAQTWAAAGAIVHGCHIQNLSTSALYLRFDGNAPTATNGLYLAAGGGYYECPIEGLPTAAATIFGATTGQAWFAEVW